jgi:hypothetical protein
MKRASERSKSFLLLLLCLWLFVFPAYHYFVLLDASDALPASSIFSDDDQTALIFIQDKKYKLLKSVSPFGHLLTPHLLVARSISLLYPVFFDLDQSPAPETKPFNLRC